MVAPWVEDIDRRGWEEYATARQEWIKEGLAYQEKDELDPGQITKTLHSYS